MFTDRVSGLPEPEDANWKLESRHAVRLTLLCVNAKLDPRPFVLSERIRGCQQRVGGCPRPTRQEPRKNLRETVRFAATANGEVTRWELDDSIDFGAGCPGRVTHQELVEHHPLTGTISSPSSATAGLIVFADAVQPSTVTATAPPIQCLLTPQGPAYEKPAIARSFPHVDFFFGDGIEKINGKPISEQLTMRFPPERFGRDYLYTRTLVQSEGDADLGKDYTYTVRFTACPRHGRDVEGCTAGGRRQGRTLPPRQALQHEVSPADPLSLLVLDLDSLEEINATEGHAAGDRLLRAVTVCLHANLPSHSAAYRLAGSQLAVTVRGGAWAAFELASDLHHVLRDEHVAIRIGVCEHEPGWSAEALLSAADVAATAARRGGRGVLVHTPALDVSDEQPDAVHQHALAVALARAVDAKDAYTHSHCETVAELSAIIASELGLDAARVERIRLAGLVHDVGKIGVPDTILHKPARLTDEEFEIIKGHAAAGHKILAGTNLADEAEWVRHHHERMDGKGYPDGRRGDQLALEARILHVADAFEAMTSDRPYRRGMPLQDAFDELLRHAGTQFDPGCAAALIARLDPSPRRAALRHSKRVQVS